MDLVGQYTERTALLAENVFYRDDLRLARSLLDDGAIGRLHLLAWRQVSRLVPRTGTFSGTPWRHDPRYRGGLHLDAGVHNIAQLRLLGGAVARVHGEVQDANATHGGPSDLTLTVRFASGAIGSYTAAYPDLAMPPEPNELHLYGDAAAMTLAGCSVQVHRPDGVVEDYRVEGTDGGYRMVSIFTLHYDPTMDARPAVRTRGVRTAGC